MALNNYDRCPVHMEDEDPLYTERFTYLGNIIRKDGGTDLDIQSRLNKAKKSLNIIGKVCRFSTYSTRTMLKLIIATVSSQLSYTVRNAGD